MPVPSRAPADAADREPVPGLLAALAHGGASRGQQGRVVSSGSVASDSSLVVPPGPSLVALQGSSGLPQRFGAQIAGPVH